MKKLQILFAVCAVLFCSLASYAAYDTLGATVTSSGTRFAIWNPDNITPAVVHVKGPKETDFTTYTLAKQAPYSDNGVNEYTDVYSYTVPGNLDGYEYYFTFNGTTVRDPYARMTTDKCTDDQSMSEIQYVNTGTLENPDPATCPTDSPPVPGPCNQIVVDLSSLTTPDFNSTRPPLKNLTDTIVYELQVMDYTSNPDAGVQNPGTFTGLAQSGTCNGQSTGLQHLIDLGITHIQIMPMYTYSFTGYSYNWGYNPLEYNVPQAHFSAKEINDYTGRIQELQDTVNTFHQNGIRVVMDVVFNHTYGASVFAPNSPKTNAYYVTDSQGGLVDFTGCGNSVNVSNPMVSNMCADSMAYWMTFYGIDGYRFDEMASFPYSVVSSWTQYLNNLNPGQNYIYYGEPWNCPPEGVPQDPSDGCCYGNISCTEYMNDGVLTPGAGCFNGNFRDALINNANGTISTTAGYIYNQDVNSSVMQNLAWAFNGSIRLSGSTRDEVPPNFNNQWANPFVNMPSESINYVCCHDGFCIWDRICGVEGKLGQPGLWSNQYLQQIDMFSFGIIMTSQGVAFFSEGDEFLRTKGGNSNSYNAPLALNWISWSAKATNLNVFKYYQKMIALRKANPAFTQSSLTDITNNVQSYTSASKDDGYPLPPVGVLVGSVKDNSGNQFVVIYNSASDYNYTVNSGSWKLLTNINDTGITSIKAGQYPAVGTVFTQGQNVLCCGTSVTVLANTENPQTPVVPTP